MPHEPRPIPEWFSRSERLNPAIMKRMARTLSDSKLDISVRVFPEQAFWFLCNTLLIANKANRDGMHANALAITRLCIEAITITELGLIGSADACNLLLQWSNEEKTAGQLRSWLASNVWPNYGAGLWSEPWATFFGNFARAIQPFAHYSGLLSQWQSKMHHFERTQDGGQAILEHGPRLYDSQKATRITLFHGLISFVLGRILVANTDCGNSEFSKEIDSLGTALGTSPYLDGHSTDWPQQFWAIMWFGDSPLPKQE